MASRASEPRSRGRLRSPKGSRVRMVVEELRNERVDVIQWAEDPAVYVQRAVACEGDPRRHRRGQPLRHRRGARRPLSLAIGKEKPERPSGRAPDRLAYRYQERQLHGRVAGSDGQHADRRGRGRGRRSRSVRLRGRGRGALPQPCPSGQPLLRRARRPRRGSKARVAREGGQE
ncbi:MAG: hypothetical protein ACLR3C_18210 [Eggerthella lenta]